LLPKPVIFNRPLALFDFTLLNPKRDQPPKNLLHLINSNFTSKQNLKTHPDPLSQFNTSSSTMENRSYVNRFYTLELTTGVSMHLQAVVDAERWFQGTEKTHQENSEHAFGSMTILDRFLVLKGIYLETAYEDRTRRQLLRYYDECKILLSDLMVGGNMYVHMNDIVNGMYKFIFRSLDIGVGTGDTFEANGYVWSPSYFNGHVSDRVKAVFTKEWLKMFLLCVSRRFNERNRRGLSDWTQEYIIPLVQYGRTEKKWVYRNGLSLGVKPCSMLCSQFDYKLMSQLDTLLL
jgi:hypothetical protein